MRGLAIAHRHGRQNGAGARGVARMCLLLLWASVWCGARALEGPNGTLQLEVRTINGAEYVSLCDAAEALGLTIAWYYEARILELRSHKVTFEFLPGSRFVLVDKQEAVLLDRALTFVSGEPLVPVSFVTKSLRPYAARFGARAGGATKVIVIDPGHGGNDPGATGADGYVEKHLTLDIAVRARALLSSRGFKVRLTRETDVTVSREQRGDIANNLGAAVLVSIHANSVQREARSISGSETFYLAKAQDASAAATERLENTPIKHNVNSMWSSLTGRLKQLFLGQHYQATRDKSISLARRVQTRVATVAIGANRGIKPANLSVLRRAFCPSCLVEVGFLSNPTDVSYLRKPWYRQKLAEAIADGIIDYLKTQ